MEDNVSTRTWVIVTILVALIGCAGACGVPIVAKLLDVAFSPNYGSTHVSETQVVVVTQVIQVASTQVIQIAETPLTSLVQNTIEPTKISPSRIPTPSNVCPLIVIEGSLEGTLINTTKTWIELGNTIYEPQSNDVNKTCSRNSDNQVQLWIGYWSEDTGYLAFQGSMSSDDAISLVQQNPGKPVLIVPWGK